MSRRAACEPPFGMGLDVESSVVRWCSPGVGSSFAIRVCDGPVGGEYSTCVLLWPRGSCHFLPRGITLTLALSHQRERGQDPDPDSSRGFGMIRLWRTSSPRGVGSGNRDGLAVLGRPPLDPSTVLRVSGPAPGMDSRIGARQRHTYSIFDRLLVAGITEGGTGWGVCYHVGRKNGSKREGETDDHGCKIRR